MSNNNSIYIKKYKCPYCEERIERVKLSNHIDKYHSEMIPDGYTSTRVAFNSINKKDTGYCIICKKETDWNETKQRYERICSNPKCKNKYIELTQKRLISSRGITKQQMLEDPEFQAKMLSSRKISGTYKFSDGGKVSYVGSYERKFLEFMDIFFHINSSDIQSPGPVIEYYYEGKKHKWITDFYYIPYNLVLDIKDGGKNPNNREMSEYRAKQVAKEKAISELGEYNYLRLTDNQFDQLIEIMIEMRESLIEYDNKILSQSLKINPIIKINESNNDADSNIYLNYAINGDKDYSYAQYMYNNYYIYKPNFEIPHFINIDILRDIVIQNIKNISLDPFNFYRVINKNINMEDFVIHTIANQDPDFPYSSLQIYQYNFKYNKNRYSIIIFSYENKIHSIYYIDKFNNLIEIQDININTITENSISSEIDTIIFDFGGVLIDGDVEHRIKIYPGLPEDAAHTLINALQSVDKYKAETCTKEEFWIMVEKQVPIELKKYIPILIKENIESFFEYEYTDGLLNTLKQNGYKLYYLSNWSKWHSNELIKAGKMNFLDKFDGGFFSWECKCMKPDVQIYNKLIDEYNINPKKSLFLDDNVDNIEAAKSIGINAIQVTDIIRYNLYNNLINFDNYDTKYINESENHDYDDRYSIAIKTIKILNDKGYNIKVKESDIEKFALMNKNGFGYTTDLCICGLGTDTDKVCKEINNELRPYGGYLKPDNYGTAFLSLKESFKENEDHTKKSSKEDAIIGTKDSICIVNYTKNNVFSGEDEDHIGVSKKDLKNLHIIKNNKLIPKSLEEFRESVSNIKIYKYIGEYSPNLSDIISIAKSESDIYTLITGECQTVELDLDNLFIEDNTFLNKIDEINDKYLLEMSNIQNNNLYVLPVLESYIEGRLYNYYTDINGYFIKNEITKERSASYPKISKIPESIKNKILNI